MRDGAHPPCNQNKADARNDGRGDWSHRADDDHGDAEENEGPKDELCALLCVHLGSDLLRSIKSLADRAERMMMRG